MNNQSTLDVLPHNGGSKARGTVNSIKHYHSNLTTTTKENKIVSKGERNKAIGEDSTLTSRYCSRFESCPVPKCPLDPMINERSEIEGDPECTMPRQTRHRYWEAMSQDLKDILPFQGYFEQELNRINAARARWHALPEDEKERIRAMGKEILAKRRYIP